MLGFQSQGGAVSRILLHLAAGINFAGTYIRIVLRFVKKVVGSRVLSLLSCVLPVDRCLPSPYVDNATAVLDQTTRSATITCLPGHRFPDGRNSKVFYCLTDGTWNGVMNCEGMSQYGNIFFRWDTMSLE
jgi:Sushi repeat (SCR repeat)